MSSTSSSSSSSSAESEDDIETKQQQEFVSIERKESSVSESLEQRKASQLSHFTEQRKFSHVSDISERRELNASYQHREELSAQEEIKSLEETVDSLTSQLTSALNSNEEVNLNDDRKDLGHCAECGLAIDKEASVVGSDHFHPDCFTCEACKKPLGSQKYFVIDGKNYCDKDRDAFLEKCSKCYDVIIGDIIRPRESGNPFHPNCFTCDKCAKPIQGKYYDKDGQTICHDDYLKSREKCGKCDEPIIGTVLKALDGSYHPGCFTCSRCPLCLDGIQFYMSGSNEALCETCYARHEAKRCDGCQEAIVEDCLVSKNTGGYFHKQCFNKHDSAISR